MSASIHARQEGLDNFLKPDGLPTEGAENELVPAQEGLANRNIAGKTDDEEPDTTVEESQLREQVADMKQQVLNQSLTWYLAEYFEWNRSDSGRFYLSPIESVMNDIIARVGERQEKAFTLFTEELKPYVADMVAAYQAQDETERALFSNADDDYGPVNKRNRNLLELAIEKFYFAATTRYELEGWQRRLTQQGKERPENFNQKADRGTEAAKHGQLLYMVLSKHAPVVAAGFNAAVPGVVKNRFYTKARIETNNQLNPEQKAAGPKLEKQVDASMDDIF